MEKITPNDFSKILADVRKAYRLLFLYQTRIQDLIQYIGTGYSFSFESGWSKFSQHPKKGKGVRLNQWAWDWLPYYLYEFYMGHRTINGIRAHFAIVLQSDTGFFDLDKIDKLDLDAFQTVEKSETRLIFIAAKGKYEDPITQLLQDRLAKEQTEWLRKTDKGTPSWLGIAYSLEDFFTIENTDQILEDFDQRCFNNLGIHLIPGRQPSISL